MIAMRQITDPAALPAEPLITTVTLAELSAGPLVARNNQERAARQAHLQQAEADFDPLPFDRAAARAFGQVAASLRKSGRKTTARAYDALIAATALANRLPVYTCNAADFEGIDGLDVVPVALPGQASR
jgi:predicted nucleic acid-binding protein